MFIGVLPSETANAGPSGENAPVLDRRKRTPCGHCARPTEKQWYVFVELQLRQYLQGTANKQFPCGMSPHQHESKDVIHAAAAEFWCSTGWDC